MTLLTSQDTILERTRDEGMQSAYYQYLGVRLHQIHRVLNKNGFLFIHLSPENANHVHVVLEAVFGEAHFRDQVILPRMGAASLHSGPDYSVLLIFSRDADATYREPTRTLRGGDDRGLLIDMLPGFLASG